MNHTGFWSMEDTIDYLAEKNGCSHQIETDLLEDTKKVGTVIRRTDCKHDATVEVVALSDAGHRPLPLPTMIRKHRRSSGFSDESPTTIDTTTMAWEFYSAQTKSDASAAPDLQMNADYADHQPKVISPPSILFPGSFVDDSVLFVQSQDCPPKKAPCAQAPSCYSHAYGCTSNDNNITMPECKLVLDYCKACYPFSKCGTSEEHKKHTKHHTTSNSGHDSGVLVESEVCGHHRLGVCHSGAHCFDHKMHCFEDGSSNGLYCDIALELCKPCFPNSRCGSTSSLENDAKEEFFQENNTFTLEISSSAANYYMKLIGVSWFLVAIAL